MTVRSSNIELLRIVSMALIIMHHFAIHGPWPGGGSDRERDIFRLH